MTVTQIGYRATDGSGAIAIHVESAANHPHGVPPPVLTVTDKRFTNTRTAGVSLTPARMRSLGRVLIALADNATLDDIAKAEAKFTSQTTSTVDNAR